MGFRKVADIVMVGVFSCVLGCTMGVRVLVKAGVPFPDWTEVNAESSQLEARSFKSFPKPTVYGFIDGAFQDDFDLWLSDRTPLRAVVLYDYAVLQRTGIRVANVVFGFDAYPTFFESDIAYSESLDALFEIPSKATDSVAKTLQRRAASLSGLAAAHDDKSFHVFAVSNTSNLSASPIMQLVSDPYDESFFMENYLDRLEGVQVIDAHFSLDEFLEGWYATDHHWNIKGAHEGYRRIATALGFGDSLFVPAGFRTYEQPSFYGSYARRGRFAEVSDHISDIEPYTGNLLVQIDGKRKASEDLAHLEMYESGEWSAAVFSNRYAEYFHGDMREIRISEGGVESESADSGKVNSDSDRCLLLVASSYSNCIERLFAKHYSTVLVFDYRKDDTPSLPDYLDNHPEIDDVVLLVNPSGVAHGNLAF